MEPLSDNETISHSHSYRCMRKIYHYLTYLDDILDDREQITELLTFLLYRQLDSHNEIDDHTVIHVFMNELIDVFHTFYQQNSLFLEKLSYLFTLCREDTCIDYYKKLVYLLHDEFKIKYQLVININDEANSHSTESHILFITIPEYVLIQQLDTSLIHIYNLSIQYYHTYGNNIEWITSMFRSHSGNELIRHYQHNIENNANHLLQDYREYMEQLIRDAAVVSQQYKDYICKSLEAWNQLCKRL